MNQTQYSLRERPRLGVWEVVDENFTVAFIGVKEDCEEWMSNPPSRPEDKPADYPFR